jgi:serine/threonine protein kinase/Tol biopolymer transport system component
MIGQRIAHYSITAHLGSGGMGDVYQATDARLGRGVALKFLPEAFAHDPERASRFEREAKALASLNHPNIAALHGLEESDGRGFLVMELVQGQTLHERIHGQPMPIDEALSIARQIADALEAAHEKGIVHRDLKPANVKVTPDGRVKVLDFGLAKLVTDEAGSERSSQAAVSNSPTIGVLATHAGVILGTAAYMAPEQAKGIPVDARADIFAFGCVLYEMLTGRPAFDGDSTADILSRVLQREPDWTLVPSNVPPSILRLLRLYLEKDPRKRRQAAGDVRLDLEQALAEPVVAPIPVARTRGQMIPFAWVAVGLAGVAAIAVLAERYLRIALPPEMRLQIVTPPTLAPFDFALSPDGHYLAFVATGSSSDTERLYLRALNDTEARPLAGTEGARLPFWSPDSRSLGFFASEQVFRIDISGGRAQPLAPAANPQGGAWSADGTIIFAPTTVTPLLRVPATGGALAAATELQLPGQTNHRRPSFLPRSRQFLFNATGPGQSAVYLGSLDASTLKRVAPVDGGAEILEPEHIVFTQQGALVARRFDVSRGEVTGDPVTIADAGSAGARSAIGFSISAAGALAYRTARPTPSRMTWFDRAGTVLGQGADLNAPSVSPDGRYVAHDRTIEGNRDVWIMDLARGGSTRFTTNAAIDGFPVWSPDGTRLVFHSQRKGTFDIWIKRFDGAAGTEELLLETPDHEWPIAWSKDGRFVLYQRSDRNYESSDLFALPMTGDNRTPIVVANTSAEERMGEFSPDGRWIAYQTSESGRPEIVVLGFPESKGIVRLSTGGGYAPRWRADGKEIYYVALDGKMMAVPVTFTGSTRTVGTPVPLFSTHIVPQTFTYQWAIAADGRFLVHNRQLADASPITMLLNWKP